MTFWLTLDYVLQHCQPRTATRAVSNRHHQSHFDTDSVSLRHHDTTPHQPTFNDLQLGTLPAIVPIDNFVNRFQQGAKIMKTILVKVQGSLSFKALEVSSYSDIFSKAGISGEYQATNADTNEVLSASSQLEDGMRLLLTLKTKGA